MAFPNGAGGYQVGDGNVNEVILGTQGTPNTYTAAATLTVTDLENGLVLYTLGTGNNLQLPLVAGVGGVDAEISSAKNNSSFDFFVISTGAGAGTVTVNTGWTLVGSGVTPVSGVGAHFRARKIADGSWNLYRIA